MGCAAACRPFSTSRDLYEYFPEAGMRSGEGLGSAGRFPAPDGGRRLSPPSKSPTGDSPVGPWAPVAAVSARSAPFSRTRAPRSAFLFHEALRTHVGPVGLDVVQALLAGAGAVDDGPAGGDLDEFGPQA